MKTKFLIATLPKKGINADLLILFFEKSFIRKRQKNMRPFPDDISNELLDYFALKDFSGEFNETALLYPKNLPSIKRILLVGLGEYDNPTKDQISQLSSSVATIQKRVSSKRNYILLCNIDFEKERLLKSFLEGVYYERYRVDKFSSKEKEKGIEHHYVFVCRKAEYTPRFRKIIQKTLYYMEAVNITRDLANMPSNILSPEKLLNETKNIFSEYPEIKVEYLDKKELKQNKMNALLAVAQGSAANPYLIIIHYKPKKAVKKKLALIGKGVTFDSGGISIKPSANMEEMKFDMAGAAAVVGMMSVVAHIKPKYEALGVIPAVENMPDGGAVKPGDIVKAYNGKTIEIINTDAEGRLILADALAYTADKYKPDLMIDFATLTGAAVVALGDKMAALFSKSDELAQVLLRAGEQSADLLWRMPLLDAYFEELKSDFADIKNIGSRWGGAVTAAKFLEQFVGKSKWAHIDMAGTAYNTSHKKFMKKGATGFGPKLLGEALNAIEKIM